MVKFLHNFALALLILGIIGSIILAVQLGKKVEAKETGYYTKKITYEEVRDGGLTAGILVGGIVSSLIAFSVLESLSGILYRLEYQEQKMIELQRLIEKQKGNP